MCTNTIALLKIVQDIEYSYRLLSLQYLGADLEDVHGRTIHDDDSQVTLPVLTLPGVVLLPGQMLPLFLFQPSLVAMIKQVLDRDRTFAYIAPRSAAFVKIFKYAYMFSYDACFYPFLNVR